MNKADGNVFIKYNPYKVETIVRFNALDEYNGEEPKDGPLDKFHLNGGADGEGQNSKRLQEWIDNLPTILDQDGRNNSYTITFHGTTLDWEDVRAIADNSHIITSCDHIQGCDPEDKIIQLKKLYEDARKLGFDNIDGFSGEIDAAFNTDFEAYVVATMSAGKSTLINALLRQKLMPSKNEACTAVVTRICDTDGSEAFSARAYGRDNEELRETIKEVTYETMERLNSDGNITKIDIEGNIPFVDAKGIPFVLVDTPGPNNSRNTDHRRRTMEKIESGEQSFIIFLLDASQNGTDSEKLLLEDIAKAMKDGGKMSRDRFLFVVNKVDNFSGEPKRIAGLLEKNRDGLAQYGIKDARIYPISAAVALTAATGLENASKKDKANAETMVDMCQLHLEHPLEGINSHIPSSARADLEKKLAVAIEQSDIGTQALIHSGVPSLEAAIKEYIEKYAKAMRIGEIADKLHKSLDCAMKEATLNTEITTDEKRRDEVLSAINGLKKKIKSGEQGKEYEARLAEQMECALKGVEKKIDEKEKVMSDFVSEYCDRHKEDRLSPDKARKISNEWLEKFRHTEDELKNDLSTLLIQGIKLNAEQFLDEYRHSIEAIMPKDEVGALPFDPFSLIGAEMTIDSTINDFASKEQKSRRVQSGTIKVKNPERDGFFGFFKIWEPWSIDNPIYTTEYYTEEFVKWKEYAQEIIGKVRANITGYCEEAKKQAENNSEKMFEDFKSKFKQLNQKLLQKAEELEVMAKEDEMLQSRINKNKQLLKDVIQLRNRLDNILEI